MHQFRNESEWKKTASSHDSRSHKTAVQYASSARSLNAHKVLRSACIAGERGWYLYMAVRQFSLLPDRNSVSSLISATNRVSSFDNGSFGRVANCADVLTPSLIIHSLVTRLCSGMVYVYTRKSVFFPSLLNKNIKMHRADHFGRREWMTMTLIRPLAGSNSRVWNGKKVLLNKNTLGKSKWSTCDYTNKK